MGYSGVVFQQINISVKNIEHKMQPYPKLTKLLNEKVFIGANLNLLQLGKKILDTLFHKVCCIRMNNDKFYKLFEKKFGQTIIGVVKTSNVSHLLMCLGDIIKNSQYDKLKQIEPQIQRCIQIKLNENPQSTVLNKTVSSLPNTSFSGFKIQFNPAEAAQSKEPEDKKTQISTIKQQQGQEENDQDERKLLYDLQGFSMHSENNLYQNSTLPDLNMTKSPENVEQYLKTRVKNPNTELTLVIQIIKLKPAPNWIQSSSYENRIQQYYIIVPPIYTLGQGDLKISGKGIALNKKNARQLAALQILRKLYERFPHILQQVLKIKKQRDLQ